MRAAAPEEAAVLRVLHEALGKARAAWGVCSPPEGKAAQDQAAYARARRHAREQSGTILRKTFRVIESMILGEHADESVSDQETARTLAGISKVLNDESLPERPREPIEFFYRVAVRALESGRAAAGLAAYEALLVVLGVSPSDLPAEFGKFNGPDPGPDALRSRPLLLAVARAALKTRHYDTAIAASRVVRDEEEGGALLIESLVGSKNLDGARAAFEDLAAQARASGDYARLGRLRGVWEKLAGPSDDDPPTDPAPAGSRRSGRASPKPFSAPRRAMVDLPDQPMFSLREFGALVRRSPATLRRWIREGRLKAAKPGLGDDKDRWLIPRKEVLRLMESMGLAPDDAGDEPGRPGGGPGR